MLFRLVDSDILQVGFNAESVYPSVIAMRRITTKHNRV
jgi:hypothetical protein